MTDSIERIVGQIEGRIINFEGKIDGLIAAVGAAETRAQTSRERVGHRLDETDARLSEVQDELQAVARKVDAIEPRITDMEPDIKELRKMRIQGMTVVTSLTFIGSLAGVTLYSWKAYIDEFFRRVFGGG